MRGTSSLFSHLISLGVGFAIMAMISLSMISIYTSETDKSAKVGLISAAESISAEIEDLCRPDYGLADGKKIVQIPRKIGGKIYSIRFLPDRLVLIMDDTPYLNATRHVFCDAEIEADLSSKDSIEITLAANSTGKFIKII